MEGGLIGEEAFDLLFKNYILFAIFRSNDLNKSKNMMVVSSWLEALGIITGYYVLSGWLENERVQLWFNHMVLPKVSQYYVRHLGKLLNVTGHPEFTFGDKLHGYLTNCFLFY